MTEQPQPRRPLFRPEAVEHHAKARVGTRRLDLNERRVTWQFRALLLGLAVAAVLAFTIRTETNARGLAVVSRDGLTATVQLSDPRLSGVERVVVVDDGAEVTGRVTGTPRPGVLAVTFDRRVTADRAEARVPLPRRSVAALLLGWGR